MNRAEPASAPVNIFLMGGGSGRKTAQGGSTRRALDLGTGAGLCPG